jgi:GT2 family glycosyltransferase
MQNPKTDIIIISYKNPELTIQCVESIRAGSNVEYNLIIVDNNSADDTVEILNCKLTNILIIENKKNLGYASAVNIGLTNSTSEYVLISNNDVIYPKSTIDCMFEFLKSDNKIGVAGAQQLYPDGKWQWSWGYCPGIKLGLINLFLIGLIIKHLDKLQLKKPTNTRQTREVGFIDGAAMFCRRSALNEVSGFDEDYFFYTEEADLCYKLKQRGWKIIFNPQYQITHIRGGSNNQGNFKEENIRALVNSKIKFCKKHLNDCNSKIYIMLEKIYSFKLWIVYSILSKLSYGNTSKGMNTKSDVMKNFYLSWKQIKSKK